MYERRPIGVIVDAGHGGEDPGALGNGLKEKDLNLQAANYMYKRLNELGIPAVITRDTDRTLSRQERINTALNSFGRNSDVILVSNHINAGNGEGAEIVYALRNSPALAQMALDNIGLAGQKIRKIYQRRLPENPSKDYYYIIRDTEPLESILVEYGFIDNTNDSNRLKNNLNNYVEGVVKAIADYLNVSYSEPNTSNIIDEVYVVKKGDTLYSISRLYNIPVSELKEINNLTSDQLSVGQKLYLVPLQIDIIPSEYIDYVVEKGDSLSKIANMFNTDVNTIKDINNLTSNTIYVGQTLRVPSNIVVDNNINSGKYIVEKGDSLWKIAKKFNTTVDNLISVNNLSTTMLKVGDVLKIPNTVDITNKYTVKSGDSLWSIARSFNTTVDELKNINGLSSNLLSIGQELIIP